ncbi:radical SAM protein [Acidiplasma aeolicum]|uniref:radical SAM protein n=1 Tax=Acidiplasma aeolicum TaxID=507754 RepID=UPI003722B7A0
MMKYEEEYWIDYIKNNELNKKEASELLNLDIYSLMKIGDSLRSFDTGDTVSYAVSYNINYTNYCTASCPICAFYTPYKIKKYEINKPNKKGYELSLDDIKKDIEKAKALNVTEIHIVGGFNPDLSIEYYESLFKEVKKYLPDVTLKAFTIPEIDFISRTHGVSIKDLILRLKEAGMDAHTGGGAEIFNENVRKLITTPEKISGEKWLEDAKLIHSLGIYGNSTMTYGHLENFDDIIDHMIRLRDNQIDTPGFLSFIPLKFSIENTPLYKMGKVRYPSSGDKDIKVYALARAILGKSVRNISVYWVALGKEMAQIALLSGGSDLVGTAFSEKVFGATNRKTSTSIEELNHLINEIGRIPALRDTFYNLKEYY